MPVGSYLGDGREDIGANSGHVMAWDKLQLGWLNYETANAGPFSTHRLGPAESNTKQAQAVIAILPPDKNPFYLYNRNYQIESSWDYAYVSISSDGGAPQCHDTVKLPTNGIRADRPVATGPSRVRRFELLLERAGAVQQRHPSEHRDEIRVVNTSAQDNFMQVQVIPVK